MAPTKKQKKPSAPAQMPREPKQPKAAQCGDCGHVWMRKSHRVGRCPTCNHYGNVKSFNMDFAKAS